jgi:hypothetical protein
LNVLAVRRYVATCPLERWPMRDVTHASDRPQRRVTRGASYTIDFDFSQLWPSFFVRTTPHAKSASTTTCSAVSFRSVVIGRAALVSANGELDGVEDTCARDEERVARRLSTLARLERGRENERPQAPRRALTYRLARTTTRGSCGSLRARHERERTALEALRGGAHEALRRWRRTRVQPREAPL